MFTLFFKQKSEFVNNTFSLFLFIDYFCRNSKVTIEGYTASETNLITTAAMTNNINYYKMVMNSNKNIKDKTANIYTATYAKSPYIMGFLEATNPLPVTLEKLIDVKYTKSQQKTVDTQKDSDGYKTGYFAGMYFNFLVGGGRLGEKAIGETAIKTITKNGTKTLTNKKLVTFAVNRFSDIISSSPININDAIKSSYDETGKVNWKEFNKTMAISTASDIAFGGILDGVGAGINKLAGKGINIKNVIKEISNKTNINFHSKAGFIRIPEIKNEKIVKKYLKNIQKYQKMSISFRDYLKKSNIEIIDLKDENDISEYFNDQKLYLLHKIKKLDYAGKLTTEDSLKLKNYKKLASADIDVPMLLNDFSKYLNNVEIDKVIQKANLGVKGQKSYSDKDYRAIFNYTACGGFEINGWLNDGSITYKNGIRKKYRDLYKDIPEIQNTISGHRMSNVRKNRDFTTNEGSIIQCLDHAISSSDYNEVIVTYRGLKNIYDISKKLDPLELKPGDSFTTPGYQSSSLLQKNAYGYNSQIHPNHKILLEIFVPPKSNSATYIENISGVTNYRQSEMLLKKGAKMHVLDKPEQMMINNDLKIVIPVLIE